MPDTGTASCSSMSHVLEACPALTSVQAPYATIQGTDELSLDISIEAQQLNQSSHARDVSKS